MNRDLILYFDRRAVRALCGRITVRTRPTLIPSTAGLYHWPIGRLREVALLAKNDPAMSSYSPAMSSCCTPLTTRSRLEASSYIIGRMGRLSQRSREEMGDLANDPAPENQHTDDENSALDDRHPLAEILAEILLHRDDDEGADDRSIYRAHAA
jgi:hypothetical protein